MTVVNFGCRLNIAEGEAIGRHLGGRADIVVVNSCAVTAEAERQARQAIRRLKRARPDADVIVTGCAAEIARARFAAMPEVARVVGNRDKLDPAKLLADSVPLPARGAAPKARTRAFVVVQNGCDHRCTFCIIPSGRGEARSVAAAAVVDTVRRHVAAGIAEVVLTGVDVTAYGADLDPAMTLGALVQRILVEVPALARLRLSSLDSVEVDDALVEAITGEARVMPHLHLSLQAGDDLVLKRMKRRHTRAAAAAFVDRVKAKRPQIAIGADIIAGFPTESEAMFANSLRLIDDCDIVYGHVFPYSARDGTPAARMPQVPGEVRRERAARLRAASAARLDRHLAAQVGRCVSVLVERGGSDGHAEDFAPVRFAAPQLPGRIVRARVTGVDGTRLLASAA
jgi:threonylcarbamoyladenosine tRNA methylthiotransferase MtaB